MAEGRPPVADLFAGLGTFAFALAKAGAKVLAAEADRAAHLACKAGRRAAALSSTRCTAICSATRCCPRTEPLCRRGARSAARGCA
jgi:tRNA/tmRNA/rRNA uracil-C5-methylase (TrmA/RlmC/RlmD family)